MISYMSAMIIKAVSLKVSVVNYWLEPSIILKIHHIFPKLKHYKSK